MVKTEVEAQSGPILYIGTRLVASRLIDLFIVIPGSGSLYLIFAGGFGYRKRWESEAGRSGSYVSDWD